MKTIPQAILNGMTSKWEKGFFIAIMDYYNYYYTTSNVIVMMNDTEFPTFCDQLALIIDNKKVRTFSKIEKSIDLRIDSFRENLNKLKIIFLNQNRFDQTIDENHIGNTTVDIYLYYKNPLSSIVQLIDMLKIYSGYVDSFKKNMRTYELNLIHGIYSNVEIPDSIINEKDYFGAPKDSIGKTIPFVYGKFLDTAIEYQKRFLVPAICTDDMQRIYSISKHLLKSSSVGIYYPLGKEYGKIISGFTYSNNSNGANIILTDPIKTEYIIKPLKRGTQLSSAYNNTYFSAVDNDQNTSLQVTSNTNFYLKYEEVTNVGTPELYQTYNYIRLELNLGTCTNGNGGYSAQIKYYFNSTWYPLNNYYIYASNSNTQIFFLIYMPAGVNFWEWVSTMEIGLTTTAGGSVTIKNMFTKIILYPRI